MSRFVEFFHEVERPTCCVHGCGQVPISWNGSASRTVTIHEGEEERSHTFPVRRVKCCTCRRSWRLLPPGVVRYRRFQPCVVAEVVAEYVWATRTMQAIADAHRMARRTVSRLVRWVGSLATPGQLAARLVELTGEVVLPSPPEVPHVARRCTQTARERASECLALLEAIGVAAGLEPPALAAIVGRLGVTPFRSPAIPDLARSGLPGRLSMFPM